VKSASSDVIAAIRKFEEELTFSKPSGQSADTKTGFGCNIGFVNYTQSTGYDGADDRT
jgi:hypothetical protein